MITKELGLRTRKMRSVGPSKVWQETVIVWIWSVLSKGSNVKGFVPNPQWWRFQEVIGSECTDLISGLIHWWNHNWVDYWEMVECGKEAPMGGSRLPLRGIACPGPLSLITSLLLWYVPLLSSTVPFHHVVPASPQTQTQQTNVAVNWNLWKHEPK
jgi:hypothetical protein